MFDYCLPNGWKIEVTICQLMHKNPYKIYGSATQLAPLINYWSLTCVKFITSANVILISEVTLNWCVSGRETGIKYLQAKTF